jgi:lipoprotein-anchoring transpeptidase ErfK/SrfK
MRFIVRIAASVVVALMAAFVPVAGEAVADVLVTIDKSSQQMSVAVDGETRYVWRVSTGRRGYRTPTGRFRPQWLARMHYSRKYDNSPMPHSIFFYHGYAIHGTEYTRRLGRVASHGCIRLHPSNAATLFSLVKRHGMRKTRIVIGTAVALKPQRPKRVVRAPNRGEEMSIAKMIDDLMQDE